MTLVFLGNLYDNYFIFLKSYLLKLRKRLIITNKK